MESEGNIRRYSAAELEALRAERGTLTDLARVRAKTEEELEQDIASDPDWRDIPRDWYKSAVGVVPMAQQLLSIRVDGDVLDWFKRQGPDYQTRMNAILRAYVELQAEKAEV